MNKLLIALVIFIVLPYTLTSQWWAGIAGTYNMPTGDFKELNKSDYGLRVLAENRGWCALWYGFEYEYYKTSPIDSLPSDTDYFEKIYILSPILRYNLMDIFAECNEYNWVPYLKTGFDISLISGTDNESEFGLGITPGLGVAYTFHVFDKCWMIDGGLEYSMPNIFYKADDRKNINYLQFSLCLSMRL